MSQPELKCLSKPIAQMRPSPWRVLVRMMSLPEVREVLATAVAEPGEVTAPFVVAELIEVDQLHEAQRGLPLRGRLEMRVERVGVAGAEVGAVGDVRLDVVRDGRTGHAGQRRGAGAGERR